MIQRNWNLIKSWCNVHANHCSLQYRKSITSRVNQWFIRIPITKFRIAAAIFSLISAHLYQYGSHAPKTSTTIGINQNRNLILQNRTSILNSTPVSWKHLLDGGNTSAISSRQLWNRLTDAHCRLPSLTHLAQKLRLLHLAEDNFPV